jgi:hypothetical protein
MNMGCVGLCQVRLGTLRIPIRMPDARCFTNRAAAIALRNKRNKDGKCSGQCFVFAMQFNNYKESGQHRKFDDLSEIDPDTIMIDGDFNFATYWDDDPSNTYWEFMNNGHSGDNKPTVYHKKDLTNRRAHQVYCVACSRDKFKDPSIKAEINKPESAFPGK